MPQYSIILLFCLSTFGVVGWFFHVRYHRLNTQRLCEQIAQDQFYISLLNTILHDILNPIVAARYSLENLRNQASEDLMPYVDKSLSAIEQLSLLVQRVRDMRAFDSGRKSLEFSSIGVNKVLSSVENTFKERMRAKDIRLVIRKDKTKSIVEMDPIIFSSYVLNNVVDNSIKFSKAGTTIEVSGYPVGDQIEFLVKDQGVGMTEESVKSLMEGKFDDICASSGCSKGLGLGMRQVAKYLELAGGSVQVESRTAEQFPKEHGTMYKIKIPRSQSQQKSI